jgi:hypothetical protein
MVAICPVTLGTALETRLLTLGTHRYAFGSCLHVEDLRADDPGQGANGTTKRKVVAPCHDNECPTSRVIV